MDKLVKIWQVGKIGYLPALKLQAEIANLHKTDDPVPDTLLLVEHLPVYTTGIRTKEYSVEEETRLRKIGAEFYRTNRGGLITFHGPGQLVVYPVLNLKNFTPSMRWYVQKIEETVIHLCKQLGLAAESSPHTGVWIGNNKVCAIGVHGSRFITTHGLALNCCTDLKWFQQIIPCGIEGKGVTSLSAELDRQVTIEDIAPLFLDSFSKIFECSFVNISTNQVQNIKLTVT